MSQRLWTDRNGAIGTDEAKQIHLVTEMWTYAKMTKLCAPKTRQDFVHRQIQILIPRQREMLLCRQGQMLMHKSLKTKIHVPVILLPK